MTIPYAAYRKIVLMAVTTMMAAGAEDEGGHREQPADHDDADQRVHGSDSGARPSSASPRREARRRG
jgi:hypothetical protein